VYNILSYTYVHLLVFLSCVRMQHVLQKYCWISTRLHFVISEKAIIIMATAISTSNLTLLNLFTLYV
jgi:hypothetical protein